MEKDYYVLFESNTDAMMLDAALHENHVQGRIAPTPHDLQSLAGCGVAMLIKPDAIDTVRSIIERNGLPFADIVRFASRINPKRDTYC